MYGRYDHHPPWVRRFYNSMAWRKKRKFILQRDNYLCKCYQIFGGKPCGRPANEVHHIKELKDFPDLSLEEKNLISMSRFCHEKTKTKSKEKQKVKGVRIIKID